MKNFKIFQKSKENNLIFVNARFFTVSPFEKDNGPKIRYYEKYLLIVTPWYSLAIRTKCFSEAPP